MPITDAADVHYSVITITEKIAPGLGHFNLKKKHQVPSKCKTSKIILSKSDLRTVELFFSPQHWHRVVINGFAIE